MQLGSATPRLEVRHVTVRGCEPAPVDVSRKTRAVSGMADFDDDQVKELLQRTEDGEPLSRICRDVRMPGRQTVYDWLESDEAFAVQFRAARARGVNALAEECLEIADTPASNAVEVADKRLRIDTRLRLAGKWLPKDYGDKVQHTGADGEGPLRIVMQPLDDRL